MITRRGDGRWVGTVTRDGRRHHIYGRTRKEVNEKIASLEQHDSTGMTVESFLSEWLRKMRPGWKDKTYQSYESELRVHITPHIGSVLLHDLSPDDIYRLLERLQREGRSARSVYYSVIVLSRALNWAVKWGYVSKNVVRLVVLPRYEYRRIEPLTVDQARALLEAVRGHRLETLYRLALSLGLRQGELINLSWGDVDLVRGQLAVRQSKTRAGRRTLELPAPLVEALTSHREQLHEAGLYDAVGLVFPSGAGTPLAGRNLHRHFKQALSAAGLPQAVRFHDLRHSCAAFLIAQGVNLHVVKEILGHSKISVTSDTYGHMLPGVGAAALDGVVRELE